MGGAPESEKALRYISQLDEARCAGRWKDIPELCRKVEKHAPHRKCLTLTARSEAQIAAHSTQRPSTAASTKAPPLANIIPTLLTAIDEEGDHVQDAFQATVCLGWLHYVLEEPGLAIARFPKSIAAVASRLGTTGNALHGWTRVCIVKGTYLKGSSQERTGAAEEAAPTYSSVLPWLSSRDSLSSESPQFKMWTEHLLVRVCRLSDQSTEVGECVDLSEALQAYRFWATYWDSTAKTTAPEGASAARSRRLAWKSYYGTLSIILRHDLPYQPDSSVTDSHTPSEKIDPQHRPNARLLQRAELKRVEAVYESLLLKETQFPKATDSNRETEAWADAVMGNWQFLCGPTWSNDDLGEGGKEGVGRGVLDILYRAATKTFHSTQILRHLFTVHASLAEFALALKAFDSYVELVTRGKDRAEKSNEEDADMDDDGTILLTSAEAIRVLCRYGGRKEAEKAVDVGNLIERWLEQTLHIKSNTSEAGSVRSLETTMSPRSLAVAYCAMGVSQAHWARFTYDADARTGIQTKAIQYLRRSLEPRFGDPNSLEALYALGLVLAEMRDIAGAIKAVKRALSPATKNKTSISVDGAISPGPRTELGRERKLIPLWHLLALLLTTRSEFSAAERSCEAAFEQFGDPTVLFGDESENNTYRSEHLNSVNGSSTAGKPVGLVDSMAAFEKGGVLQVKMTQLALIETVEGVAAAVDGCDELLALYARLFGDPAADQVKLQPPATAAPPPRSAVGTIRGGIFRSRGSVKSTTKNPSARNSSVPSDRPSTVATHTAPAPAIQVTDENGTERTNGHRPEHAPHSLLSRHKHDNDTSVPVRTPSKLKKRSANSLRRQSETGAGQPPQVPNLPEGISNGTPSRARSTRAKSPRRPSMSSSTRKSVESQGDQPLRTVPHNILPSSEPPPIGHSRQPPKQDTRLPAPLPSSDYIPPDPQFSKIQEHRHKMSLLVSIWVYISGLYARAKMYEDAEGAVNEALKLADAFQSEVSQESSASKAFADKGWGGGSSVEELWAEAFAARGDLLVAQSLKHSARSAYERALMHYPDHPQAIVGLSDILLDIYCKIIPLEPTEDSAITSLKTPSVPSVSDASSETRNQQLSSHTPSAENNISPQELCRLASRDRAFGLLSTLTKLGTGWDYSEAWYTLARAYEESGEMEKTKEVLWWCVELEDTHPVRNWKNVGLGGFVL
ncbi:filamentation protein-like protein [Amniculicola lignicola CBS 123094]|uniref:Filamentation protein-like protein n=1 Tax=Amniculicola lignicola CBS 123094 TaxID=1392246 RepID=A0A6A5W4U6_9PLEO|nr:filamentation protein-like protein [Amniculicola lignicola CBS 123094]